MGDLCDQCQAGPCEFITSRDNPGRPNKPRRRRRHSPKGKPFPRERVTELYMDVDQESIFYPMTNLSFGNNQWDSEQSQGDVIHSGCMFKSSKIVEINRLPTSNGTQVIHEQLYMSAPEALGLDDTWNWFVKTYPPASPGSYDSGTWSTERVQTSYVRAKLIEALSPSNRPYEDLLPHGLISEIAKAEAYAFNAMRPSFKTGFSTLNFLLELKDLKSLVPNTLETLRGFYNNLSATLKVYGDLSKAYRGRRLPDLNRSTLNQILNFTAEVKLTKDFGIEPLIRDIDSVCSVLKRLDNNVRAWREGTKALQLTRHFKASIEASSEYKESLTQNVTVPLTGCQVNYECKVTSFDSQSNGTPTDHVSYNATMAYTYASKTLGDIDPYVAALYTGLGIVPDASIIWNAIPFSFVLDWFVNIQGFLDKYASLDLITSEVTIQSWLTGIRSRPVWTCTPLGVTWQPGHTGTHLMPTITLRGQSYSRLLAEPDIDQLVSLNSETPDGLTLNRGFLTAALAKKIVFRKGFRPLQ